MALHPLPAQLSSLGDTGGNAVQPLPELGILHRLFRSRLPATLFPAGQPLGDTLDDVLGIGVELHRAGTGQCLQPLYRRHQFHAVIGRLRFRAVQVFLLPLESQAGAPATRPRIAATGAIGIDLDNIYSHSVLLKRVMMYN